MGWVLTQIHSLVRIWLGQVTSPSMETDIWKGQEGYLLNEVRVKGWANFEFQMNYEYPGDCQQRAVSATGLLFMLLKLKI